MDLNSPEFKELGQNCPAAKRLMEQNATPDQMKDVWKQCIKDTNIRGVMPQEQYNLLPAEGRQYVLDIGLYTTQEALTQGGIIVLFVLLGLGVCGSIAAAAGFFYFNRKRNSMNNNGTIIVA